MSLYAAKSELSYRTPRLVSYREDFTRVRGRVGRMRSSSPSRVEGGWRLGGGVTWVRE